MKYEIYNELIILKHGYHSWITQPFYEIKLVILYYILKI